MLNLPYQQQLNTKMAHVISSMGRFCHVDKIKGMDEPLYYRNKVQSAFGILSGNQINGIYQSASRRIVRTDSCLLEDKTCSRVVRDIAIVIKQQKISIYSPKTGKGLVRHVLVRRGKATGEVMVVLVTSTTIFPQADRFVQATLEKCKDITTIVQVVNDTNIFLWLGEREKVLFGKGYIEDILCGKKFIISPKSFYQVNPTQTEYLYSKAIEFASPNKDAVLLDAYCGIGTIGIIAADRAKAVIGVESNADAVKDAKANAKINGIKNIRFFCQDAGSLMAEITKANQHIDTVITDPPRAGCSREFLQHCVKLLPNRIVYVSCCVQTLARDCAYLTKNGYVVKKVVPVDMFPHTVHIECCVLLSRK